MGLKLVVGFVAMPSGPERWIKSVSSLTCIRKSGGIGCGRPSRIARSISAMPSNLS